MHAPVLVSPPSKLPVTLDEAKLHLRVDGSEEDGLIVGMIRGAVSHLDGWTGILGRCLVEQTWRQDFDHFRGDMRLRLGPVTDIVSVTYRNAEGQIATVPDTNYALVTDSLGPRVFWDRAYSAPTGLYEQGAVSVTFKAGYPDDEDGKSGVPEAIKIAILLMVGNWYRFRTADVETSVSQLPMGVASLLSGFRGYGI